MKIIKLPFKVNKPILACGADLKGAFALAKGNKAYLVKGFGDLSDPDNLRAYEASIGYHEKKLNIKPRVIACDHHPGYFSSRSAEMHGLELMIPDLYDIQHHEAHIASAIIEYSINVDVIGVAFDGTGYGWDDCIWGGEFFVGKLKNFKRAAHFEYLPMPGGEMAIKEPWRMAVSYLYRAFGEDFLKLSIGIAKKIDKKRWPVMKKMLDGKINSPVTSSAGRLFDAAASLILAKNSAAFEAELPMELERVAAQHCDDCYKFDIGPENGVFVIGASRLIRCIVDDLCKKVDKGIISAKFHNTVAEIIAVTASRLGRSSGLKKIVLSGGVFQNKYLVKRAELVLNRKNFHVYIHSNVDTNDHGIPIGQLAIANVRGRCA